MQCGETISHVVTAGRSYFRTLRNACLTADKTTMTAGKIYHGCFEMLSWPHRTSANIINICFWLLETCTKCSYFIEENIRPGTQRLAFEVKYKYTVRRSTNIPWAGGLHLGKFPDSRCLMCCALLKRTTAITQAGFGSQTIWSGTVAFKTLRCVIEVAYIFASVKSITVKFLVWENTTRKELQPLELISKVTTEFAYNGTSRGLHKERYCRIDITSELKCI